MDFYGKDFTEKFRNNQNRIFDSFEIENGKLYSILISKSAYDYNQMTGVVKNNKIFQSITEKKIIANSIVLSLGKEMLVNKKGNFYQPIWKFLYEENICFLYIKNSNGGYENVNYSADQINFNQIVKIENSQ